MFSSLITSIFIIYLYRKLNAVHLDQVEDQPAESVEAELAALNAQIDALEAKLSRAVMEQ